MTGTYSDLSSHSASSLHPPLGVMEALGFERQACLRGTGILLSQLDDPDARMSLQQELAFYRNVLELSGDPAIGLKLGEPFVPQRYGLFGYALLSAATFRHALSLIENFGRLTFSFFTFRFGASGSRAWFTMSDPPPLEWKLTALYLDRDLSAARVAFGEILGYPFDPHEVHFSHDGHGCRQAYTDWSGCEVLFEADCGRFVFDSALLDKPLPQSDPTFSRHLQQQCQMLIGKLSNQGQFIDTVRMMVLARPGYFPDIDYVAEKLGFSTRTLRRRLSEAGSSYRDLLDEVRFGLAREYLADTSLPMEEISLLLGYSESGNFSHAFRRWSGQSPTQWRQNT
jgi:AraC-like DNA-binding protein